MLIMIHTKVEWHDLQWDPDDLPEAGDKIFVTLETIDGARRTYADIYLKILDDDEPCWCRKVFNPDMGCMEETMVWEKVVAWAYYPSPYVI